MKMDDITAWNRFVQTGKVEDYLIYCQCNTGKGTSHDDQNQCYRSEAHFSVGRGQDAIPSVQRTWAD